MGNSGYTFVSGNPLPNNIRYRCYHSDYGYYNFYKNVIYVWHYETRCMLPLILQVSLFGSESMPLERGSWKQILIT